MVRYNRLSPSLRERHQLPEDVYKRQHLFSHAGAPWLTQYWVRRIKKEVFGNITPFGGYNGDEDQGQIDVYKRQVEAGSSLYPGYGGTGI